MTRLPKVLNRIFLRYPVVSSHIDYIHIRSGLQLRALLHSNPFVTPNVLMSVQQQGVLEEGFLDYCF